MGDLVKWYSVQNDTQEEFDVDIGIVIKLSRSGHRSLSAQVLFEDQTVDWVDTIMLEVINKAQEIL